MAKDPKTYEDGLALKRFVKFMSDNEETAAVMGFRVEKGKLEVDCSIGEDDEESNPSYCYKDSISEAVNETMRRYEANRSYFQRQKSTLKRFYDKVNKKKHIATSIKKKRTKK